jgi:hypothetical protein
LATPLPTLILPRDVMVVSGGQARAHAPVQWDLVPLSAANAYRVKPRPSVRIVPSEVRRTVSSVTAAAPGRELTAVALIGAEPDGPAALLAELTVVPPAVRTAAVAPATASDTNIRERFPASTRRTD